MSLAAALLGVRSAVVAIAPVTVETPIDGQTGVWIKSGGVIVGSGMSMTGAVVGSGQTQYVYNRGAAISGSVSSGGTLRVSSGGVVSGVSALDGAAISAFVGATISNAELRNSAKIGGLTSGVSVNGLACYDSQAVTIGSAAVVANYRQLATDAGQTTVNAGGSLLGATVNRYLYNSGYVSGAVISGGGFAVVYPTGVLVDADVYRPLTVSGSASDIRVKALYVKIVSGGTATGITVSSGCSLTVSGGGSALAVVSNAGAVVTVKEGGYIEYVTA